MRPRNALVIAGTLLCVATLCLAGYQVATRYSEGGPLLDILGPAFAVATALLCIGVLDWARNLGPSSRRRRSSRSRDDDDDIPLPETARPAVRAEARLDLAAAVQAVERLADDERGADETIAEALRIAAELTRASAATLWAVARAETPEPAPDAQEPRPAHDAAAFVLRAHWADGQVVQHADLPDVDAPLDALAQALDQRKPLQTLDDASASFLLPLFCDQEAVGVLRLVVPLDGDDDARRNAAQKMAGDLAQLAGPVARAIHAPELYQRAVLDAGTGLYTRRHFVNRLTEATGACRRYGEPLCLILLDVDHFRRLCAAHGQPVGDRVLRNIADLVHHGIRECDSAYRYGADEIAVILPGSDVDSAARVAERLRVLCRAARTLGDDGRDVLATVSAGVACFDEDMRGIGPLMAHADEALQAAKTAGRNRVERWAEPAGADDFDDEDL